MAITIILIAVLIFMMKVLKIKIMEPAGIYSVVWILFILGSIFSLENKYEFEYLGVIWILMTCYIFIIVSKIVCSTEKIVPATTVRYPVIPWKILLFIIGLAMCSIVYMMLTTGVSFSVFSDFSSLQNTAHMSAVDRYSSNGEGGSLVSQILGSFIYIAPICAGYSYIYAEEKKEKIICFSSVIPAVLSMLLTSAKLSLITFVILFFIGYYVSTIYTKKRIPRVKTKTLLMICIAAIVLYLLFYLSFVLRIGSGEKNLSQVIQDKLMVYAFGHIQGFDIWFSKNAFDIKEYGFGKNTFLAISSKLGLAEKKQGVYGFLTGTCTNVFTQYRGLIEDFGIVFSIMILLIVFLISCLIIKQLLSGKKVHIISQTVLAANLFWLLYFIVSAWTYTSYILTFVVFFIYLYISFNLRFTWGKKK